MGHAKDALAVRSGESPLDLSDVPLCPRCGTAMEARRAKHGRRDGERFWGCPNFFKPPPDKCDGTINIEKDATWSQPLRRRPTIVRAASDPTMQQLDRVARRELTKKDERNKRIKEWQRQRGQEDKAWGENEIDEKLEEWMQEDEKPREIKPETELQLTYKLKISKKASKEWMTAMSIRMLLGDEDIEIVSIIDRAGKKVSEDELP